MFWGGLVFTSGWIMRILSSYHPTNLNLYIAQTCLTLAGPPIYAASEYNILGRLMHYLPMHAPLHPGRLLYVFIYLGAAVESMTAAGASLAATSVRDDAAALKTGGTLVSVSLVLQAAVECLFLFMIALMHYRAARSRMLAKNIKTLCIMLYGTSTLILIRCIFRAIESFATFGVTEPEQCSSLCRLVMRHEWYLYVFEALPMAVYTIWLNIIHPGRFLPRDKAQYLDIDGSTERLGPGWIDRRSKWETFVDPFDLTNTMKGQPSHEKYWLRGEQWPIAIGGSFAQGTAGNAGRSLLGRTYSEVSRKAEA